MVKIDDDGNKTFLISTKTFRDPVALEEFIECAIDQHDVPDYVEIKFGYSDIIAALNSMQKEKES